MASRSPRCTATCWMNSQDCSLCISGPMMMPRNWPKDCAPLSTKPIHKRASSHSRAIWIQIAHLLAEVRKMRWVGDKFRRRLKVAGFLVLLLGGAAFLAVTDNDEGPSLWQRWTK